MGGTIIIDELLEVQCGQVCMLKIPWEPSHTKGLSLLIVLPLGVLPYSHSEDQKNNPLVLSAGQGEMETF